MAVTASITGLKVYDPTREAGECASLSAEVNKVQQQCFSVLKFKIWNGFLCGK